MEKRQNADSELSVSPYLLRPVRSLSEVLEARRKGAEQRPSTAAGAAMAKSVDLGAPSVGPSERRPGAPNRTP